MSNGDDAMTSAEFAKLMGAYPEPAGNPSPAYGGFMDNSAANFSWVQNNDYFGAEGMTHCKNTYCELPYDPEIFGIDYQKPDAKFGYCACEMCDGCGGLFSTDLLSPDEYAMGEVCVKCKDGKNAESFNAEDSCLWCEEGTKGNYRHEGRPTDYCSPFCYNKGELGMDAESPSPTSPLYIKNSSIFDNPDRKYDARLYIKILKEAGATKVWLENAYGWSNQPKVVIFTGLSMREAEKALDKGVSYGERMMIHRKDAHWDAEGESFSADAEHFDDVAPLDGPCLHCGNDMFTEAHKSWFCDRESGGCGIVAHFVNPFEAESESNSCDACQKDKPIVAHVEFDGPFLSALCKECYAEHLEMGGKPNVYGAESFNAEDDKDYIDSELEMMMDEALGIKGENYLWSGVTFAEDGAYFDLNAGPGGLYPAHPLRKKIDDFMESCGYPPSPPLSFPNPYYYFFDNPSKDAESFNTENLSREGTYNIDIDAYIDNEDELEEKGYSQRDIEAMKQEVENKYKDGDEVFEDLKTNELDIAIDGRLENDRDSVYLKYGDKMVGGVESGIDYGGDFGGFNDAETEYHGLSAEEYYAELNEFYADMEELTDGVSAIKNRFGDSVGMVQVDDEDLEDVSVEITDTDGGVVYEGILADDEVPDMEEEDYYLAEMKKPSLLALALGVGAVLLGGSLLKDKLVKNADNDIQEVLEDDPELIESPNMGDLSPADYEELVVESTGYAVDVIPMSLDGAFMGSRFAALPTERYVEYNDPGIGAHTDIALTRNENFLEPEMAMVQAAEGENVVKETQAPGQSPYLSMDGQEPKDFSYRVLKETHPVSLDPAVVPFIPQSMAGYTGNDNRPPSVYNKMFNLGVLGQTPLFVPGNNDDIGSSHTGSRRATPSKMGNIGGPLSDAVNASYTDGQTSKSLAQWSIENKVQQTSDTEAMVIDRSSGNTKRIRRV